MQSFFTGRRIVVALLLGVIILMSVFVLVSLNMTFFQPTLFNLSNIILHEKRSSEETKTFEQNLTILKNSGVCIKCDLGWRFVEFEEKETEYRDLRQEIQIARSKGLTIDLSQSNLCRANLSGINLSGANLSEAFLMGANLTDADLTKANLSGATLAAADLQRANLTGANLHGAELVLSDLRNANLTGADLTDAIIFYKMWDGAILAQADLRGAMIWQDLSGVDLTDAKLDGVFKRLFIKGSFFLRMWWDGRGGTKQTRFIAG
ncbi:MAG TPA: pentapeptide repeat-containing protein [Candidatus Babeliales bacterium]|jgi:uncharacterized protein YjbI with pentapeptide repeats|nr:pentapeptide repeat-containing protein [Candidatus Babeliales bacterium]